MGTCLHGGHCTGHCLMRAYAATGGALPLPVLEAPSWTRPCPMTFCSAPLHPTTALCPRGPTLRPAWGAYGVSGGQVTLAAWVGAWDTWGTYVLQVRYPSAHAELDISYSALFSLSFKSFLNNKTARWFTLDVIIKYCFYSISEESDV